MSSAILGKRKNMDTPTTTFIDIFRNLTIRNTIFKSITDLSNINRFLVNNIDTSVKYSGDDDDDDGDDDQLGNSSRDQLIFLKRKNTYVKGRDIPTIYDMISKFAMPFDFVRKQLDTLKTKIDYSLLTRSICHYCSHPNATVETLDQLLQWYPKFEQPPTLPLLDMVVPSGNIEILKRLLQHNPQLMGTFNTIEQAARHGHLEIIQYLNQVRPDLKGTWRAVDNAAASGHLHVVQYLHQQGYQCFKALNLASAAGHLATVEYLHHQYKEQCKASTDAMDQAAKNGHYNVLVFLHQNRKEGCSEDALESSAKYGHLSCVQYLYEKYPDYYTPMVMDLAAESGNLEIVKYFHSIKDGLECTKRAMDFASAKGHLSVIEFLDQNRSEGCTFRSIDQACRNGHFKVVEYLLQHRNEGFKDAITYAKENNDNNMIKLLQNHIGKQTDGFN